MEQNGYYQFIKKLLSYFAINIGFFIDSLRYKRAIDTQKIVEISYNCSAIFFNVIQQNDFYLFLREKVKIQLKLGVVHASPNIVGVLFNRLLEIFRFIN